MGTVPIPGFAAMLSCMATITAEEARQRLIALSDWRLTGNAIQRKFTFKDFPEALTFVVRLGFAAEAADHHPDILINYRRVTLTYSTHSEGGLTEKDFAGAGEAMKIAARFGASEQAAEKRSPKGKGKREKGKR